MEVILGGGWRILITLVVGVVIGFGGATLWFDRSDTTDVDTDVVGDTNGITVPTIVDEEEPQSVADNDEVLIKDQNAGESVFISRVSLSRAGWVAVREAVDGGLGNVLGARILDAGSYQGEQIDLLRATAPNQTYFSVMYHDNGDREFSFTDDLQVVDENGALLVTSFETYDSNGTEVEEGSQEDEGESMEEAGEEEGGEEEAPVEEDSGE